VGLWLGLAKQGYKRVALSKQITRGARATFRAWLSPLLLCPF
jgi:hypothetical protein